MSRIAKNAQICPNSQDVQNCPKYPDLLRRVQNCPALPRMPRVAQISILIYLLENSVGKTFGDTLHPVLSGGASLDAFCPGLIWSLVNMKDSVNLLPIEAHEVLHQLYPPQTIPYLGRPQQARCGEARPSSPIGCRSSNQRADAGRRPMLGRVGARWN